MAAPKGNEYWRLILNPGRKRIYNSVEELQEGVLEYLEFIENNKVEVEVNTKSGIKKVKKQRPMLKRMLLTFLGIHKDTWADYKKREGFTAFITAVEDIIFEQKFVGAAIGEFKENLIARELGLADKQEVSAEFKRPILENGKALPGDDEQPIDDLLK